MIPDHISDEHFQMFFDGSLNSQEKSNLLNHLDECDLCSTEFSRYKELYYSISEKPDFNLSSEFINMVVQKAMPSQGNKFSSFFFNAALSLVIFLGVLTAGYFTDFKKLTPDFSNFHFLDKTGAMISSLGSQINLNSPGIQLILMGVLTLIVIAIIDKAIRSRDRTTLLPLL